MDPITAVSLASSIITFVEFGMKLVDGVREIYLSAAGRTAQNATAELVVTELELWSARLAAPSQPHAATEEEAAIYTLADECKAICSEMLTLLDKSQPQRLGSKASAAVAVIKDAWHRSDREKCKTRLHDCRKQLKVQVAALDRTKIKASLQDLVDSARCSDERLIALEKAADDIKTLVTSFSTGEAVAEQLRKLQMVPDGAVREIAEQRILSLLAFPDMRGRFEQVGGSHESTFRWILQQEPPANPIESLSDMSFVDWLSTSGSRIFHISGKLGSGKSTLMKFLCESDRLKERLGHWADGKQLVIISFFFWRAGNTLQKSLDGLVRSLLHGLLEQRPDLIPSALPEHWRKITSMHLHAQPGLHLDISRVQIQQAFDQLVRDRQLYERHCFCVFIDGLDEYDETLEHYYEDMTTLLLGWAAAEPESLKICVSSRELPVFLKAFSDQPRLRLQDLTRTDIENFIRARIRSFWASDQDDENDGAEEQIVSNIADKANGVFLWVALVLKTLQEGCRNGDQLKSLLKKIDDLPEDIEPLYEHLLRSIPRADRQSVYRTFAVVMRLMEADDFGMSILQYSFLEDFADNPMFAIEAQVCDPAERQYELRRLERAHNRLRGQCKGLLEVRSDIEAGSDIEADSDIEANSDTDLIAFIHRSVYDFFLREDINRLYEIQLRGFDALEAISQTYLAELKFRGRLRHSANGDIKALLTLRKQGNAEDTPPYQYLESLRDATLLVQGVNREAELGRPMIFVSRRDLRDGHVLSVFYIAADVGLLDYVSWVLENDFAISDDMSRFQRVVNVIFDKFYDNGGTEALPMVLRFLKQGRHLDDTTSVYWGSHNKNNPTIWENSIIAVASRVNGTCQAHRDDLGEILEILLKAGLKSDYNLTYKPDGEESNFMIRGRYIRTDFRIEPPFPCNIEEGESLSLSDIVDCLESKNKDTLKRYIRGNLDRGHAVAASNITSTLGTDNEDGCKPAEIDRSVAGDIHSRSGLELETESSPDIVKTDFQAALEEASDSHHSEAMLPLPFESEDAPTIAHRRREFGTFHDFSSWYPFITFGLGIAVTIAWTRYPRGR